nr:immunoglobulin light chain junction region [Macaca mulatta]
CQHGYAFPYSF